MRAQGTSVSSFLLCSFCPFASRQQPRFGAALMSLIVSPVTVHLYNWSGPRVSFPAGRTFKAHRIQTLPLQIPPEEGPRTEAVCPRPHSCSQCKPGFLALRCLPDSKAPNSEHAVGLPGAYLSWIRFPSRCRAGFLEVNSVTCLAICWENSVLFCVRVGVHGSLASLHFLAIWGD